MIDALVQLLILLIVFGIVYYIVTLLPLPAPFKQIATVVVLLIFLLVIVAWLLPLAGVGHPLLLR